MKVLYISTGSGQDYLRDCAAHGFRSLLGPDFVDVGKLDSLYQGADRSQMYGRGFTLYSLLPDIEIDRTDIPNKIRTKYFDLVVYGSIHRCHDHLHEVASMYPPERVVFLDGEDHPGYLKGLGGVYFKREMHNPFPGVWPIQFAIPVEKILKSPPTKTRMMAPCDPIDTTTYIYKTEESYYAQYAESYYGTTMKKAGWDCLRHYEIISQWCLPYFRAFESCPPSIMSNLPRRELRLIQEALDYGNLSPSTLKSLYQDLINPVVAAILTTEGLATYILSTVGVRRKEILC